jgi:hypothetical protein
MWAVGGVGGVGDVDSAGDVKFGNMCIGLTKANECMMCRAYCDV